MALQLGELFGRKLAPARAVDENILLAQGFEVAEVAAPDGAETSD
jgi:hypothetical protein